MNANRFLVVTGVLALAFSYGVWEFVFGAADDRFGLHYIYAGGFLVVILMALWMVAVALCIERVFALSAAAGRRRGDRFLTAVLHAVENKDYTRAKQLCVEQEGLCATVLAAGLARWSEGHAENEVTRTTEQHTNSAVPALEQNLAALSTIASIATMIGLLGTTIGMIRSFKALAQTGAPDAVQLSIGISEALINTAGGLIVAILAIIGYNYCSHKVDQILQHTDEAVGRTMNFLRSNGTGS